jgi:hypothetical protein
VQQRKWSFAISICLAFLLILGSNLTGNAQGYQETPIYQPTFIAVGEPLPLGDGSIGVILPEEWRIDSWDSVANAYFFHTDSNENTLRLLIMMDTAQWVFFHIMNKHETCFDNPRDFLEKIRDELIARNQYSGVPYVVKEIHPTKIGLLDGFEMQGEGAVIERNTFGKFYYHVATLPNGKLLLITMYGNNVDELKVKTAFREIEDGLILHSDHIATTHPLLLTATALQEQICALTPTPTVQPTATSSSPGL